MENALEKGGFESRESLSKSLEQLLSVIELTHEGVNIELEVSETSKYFSVCFECDKEGMFMDSLDTLFSDYDTPRFVRKRFRLVNEILNHYGKRLKRKFQGFFVEMEVVEI